MSIIKSLCWSLCLTSMMLSHATADEDRDGVIDALDKCPVNTVAELAAGVDKEGCPKDSDGDGVGDYFDKCPNTPAGVTVDKHGCGKASEYKMELEVDEEIPMPAKPSPSPTLTVREAAPATPMRRDMLKGQHLMSPSPQLEPTDRENYAHFDNNPLKRVSDAPLSTFSIDVDTGAYSNIRRMLNNGRMPRKDAVRVEEMINYFPYAYAKPSEKIPPFSVHTHLQASSWNAKKHVLHIGIQGYAIDNKERPAANLVFLLDVSGSMNSTDKLGLLKSALKMLSQNLSEQDKVTIVVYAGAAGLVLPTTAGNNTAKINQALDQLQAGGSTNGGQGIELAYSSAEAAFIKGGINRILLATDGDFNVGNVNFEGLKDMVARKRENGVSLTTLGFGTGNYNDHLMEQLADVGNGHYAYIDTLNEARKVLVEQINSTLFTIASDVKIQIEFNPAQVSEYRLIGYENRALKDEDFDNDKVDAGEIGAGHQVTAIYELALSGAGAESLPTLRYQQKDKEKPADSHDFKQELAFLRLRYKAPGESKSRLIETPISTAMTEGNNPEVDFANAVAAFGQLLRGGEYLGEFSYVQIADLARKGRGEDTFGYRAEFINLIELAKALDN